MHRKRNQRALNVIRMLRTRQRKQDQKIDILCRDMVSAHEQFSLKLTRAAFAVSFMSRCWPVRVEETLDRAVSLIRAIPVRWRWPRPTALTYIWPGQKIRTPSKNAFSVLVYTRYRSSDRQTNRVCSLYEMLKMVCRRPRGQDALGGGGSAGSLGQGRLCSDLPFG